MLNDNTFYKEIVNLSNKEEKCVKLDIFRKPAISGIYHMKTRSTV